MLRLLEAVEVLVWSGVGLVVVVTGRRFVGVGILEWFMLLVLCWLIGLIEVEVASVVVEYVIVIVVSIGSVV